MTLPLPSVILLAKLREAFLLPSFDSAQAQQFKRLRNGNRPSETAIQELVQETIAAITRKSIIGWEATAEQRRSLVADVTLMMTAADLFHGMVSGGDRPTLERVVPLRVVPAIDDATRWAAYAVLTGAEVPVALPMWMFRESDTYVRELVGADRIIALHRKYAEGETLGLGRRTFDGFLAGGRPESDESMSALVRMIGGGPDALQRMRFHFALRFIMEVLAERWAWDAVRSWCEERRRLAVFIHAALKVVVDERLIDPALIPRAAVEGISAVSRSVALRGAVSHLPDPAIAETIIEAMDRSFWPHLTTSEDERTMGRVLRKLGNHQGAMSLALMGLVAEGAAKHPEWFADDVVREPLREVQRLKHAGELAPAWDRLTELREDHGADPRVLMMSALLAWEMGRPQDAKRFAKAAADTGFPGVRAMLDQIPEVFDR